MNFALRRVTDRPKVKSIDLCSLNCHVLRGLVVVINKGWGNYLGKITTF